MPWIFGGRNLQEKEHHHIQDHPLECFVLNSDALLNIALVIYLIERYARWDRLIS